MNQPGSERVRIVCATRVGHDAFWRDQPLGQSLPRLLGDPRLRVQVAFDNRSGLPSVYNASLREGETGDALVFLHDDVWIDEEGFVDAVLAGLRHFDVLGVAGNRRRVPGQPSWLFVDTHLTRDDPENLSGTVAHGSGPGGERAEFGPAPLACELLDGVLLATRAGTLRSRGVAFDERFGFHFYDLDFCRSARARGLRLGTWPIGITHRSGGAFRSPAWRAAYRDYIAKWGIVDAPGGGPTSPAR